MATPEIETLYGELAMRKDRVLQLAAAVATTDNFNMGQHETCIIGIAQEIVTGSRARFGDGGWGSAQLWDWLNIDPGTLPLAGGALWNPGIGVYARSDHPSYALPEGVYGLTMITREHAVKMLTHFAETGEINWRT